MHDLLVVGAGPYGLSIASHATAAGLDVRVLGRPMQTWREHMPRGMFLTSESCAEVQGYLVGKPLPIEAYAGMVGREADCAEQVA